jgi:hypothetical protein
VGIADPEASRGKVGTGFPAKAMQPQTAGAMCMIPKSCMPLQFRFGREIGHEVLVRTV